LKTHKDKDQNQSLNIYHFPKNPEDENKPSQNDKKKLAQLNKSNDIGSNSLKSL